MSSRRGWAKVLPAGSTNLQQIGRVDLETGVGTVLLQQFPRTDPPGTTPWAFVRATLSYGVDGARYQVVGDWLPGARVVIVGDYVEISAQFVAVPSRHPIEIALSASVVDGASGMSAGWWFTERVPLGPASTTVLQVPQGAYEVALVAPSVLLWGSFTLDQQTAQTGGVVASDTPVNANPEPLIPGVRWISVTNNSAGSEEPLVRFKLT